MMLERNFSVSIIPLLAAVCLLILGCHTTPKGGKFNIEMAPGGDIKTASVEVDLIGATEREKSYWETYPIDKYWEPEDPGRRAAQKFTVRLDDGKVKNLTPLDPIWDKWLGRGDIYLVLIAHLPGDFKSLARDPRREILSLETKNWKTSKSLLQIEIQERLIKILTLEKAR